ncbi:ACP S-malonyltransferase [Streptomyces natalensis]|uniref:[acyl-carrier-protein] S-malonyltransferase n=1 Tax=Streptomyces natalensis ATCC 27448 TaxID=1240678 RepID=A0A0D7CVX4_9ACTN|nr:ACP S-malonyltransferase [Streptomyces natalensis]KIZ19537.1 hypothetical protein SNA_03255 [Streptomyces natalensis ATCC 27448]
MTDTGAYIFPSQVFLDTEMRKRCLESKAMRILLDLASDTLSMDFRAILRDGTEEEANDPRFRRPLINIMGVAGYREEVRRRDVQPVCVTGISLGYLSAAGAVGWVSLEDMVRMSNTMAAIEIEAFDHTDYRSVFFYNGDHVKVFDALRAEGLDSLLHMSVVVSSNQFIAACRKSDMDAMKPALMRAGALFKVIPYSFPGHCDLMGDVQETFTKEWTFKDPYGNTTVPLVSINDCRPYTSGEEVWKLTKEQYTTVLDWRGVLDYLDALELDSYVVLEPSDFVVKSMKLDPFCRLRPQIGGVLDGV